MAIAFGEREGKDLPAHTGIAGVSAKDEYDFYRCTRCHQLLTLLQERVRLPTGKICPCGSMRYSPSWPTFWEWLRPSVLHLIFLRIIKDEDCQRKH